jgi:hypothetical protein
VLETVLRRKESNCKRLGCVQPNSNSVQCARLVRVNSSLSGFDDGVRLKITGPSGGAPDCPVSHRDELIALGKSIRATWL